MRQVFQTNGDVPAAATSRRRRVGLPMLVFLVVVVPTALLRADSTEPESVQTHSLQDDIVLGLEHVNPPDLPPADDANAVLWQLQLERTQTGSLPLDLQIASLSRASGKSPNAVEEASDVVVTFSEPVPADHEPAHRLMPAGALLTVYAELSDGYPFTATGRSIPGALETIESFMRHLMEQPAAPAPPGADSAPGLDPETVRQGLERLRENTVVLGFRLPTHRFRREEAEIRRTLPVHAAEVELDETLVPFRAWQGPLTAERIEECRRLWTARAVGPLASVDTEEAGQ